MAVTLRSIYEGLSWFSTATHIEMCQDFLRKIKASGDDHLARLFVDSVTANASFNQVERPFLDSALLAGRKPLDEKSRGTNRVTFAMSQTPLLTVDESDGYSFRYVEREVPHLRTESAIQQEDKGWIDYIAATTTTPILGEIKYDSDQNAFYALIQLLTYLSELLTDRQLERTVRHRLFGESIGSIGQIDLHILLADFNDRGSKGKLIQPTCELASEFKRRLATCCPDLAQKVGNILCISATLPSAESPIHLKCLWRV